VASTNYHGRLDERTPPEEQSLSTVYLRIQRDIAVAIAEGEYAPGSRIPSETSLAKRFGVTRMTVRHAVDGLIREGLVTRRHGSGTYVSHRPQAQRALNRLSGFTEDIRGQGRQTSTTELSHAETEPPERVQDLLELQDGAHVVRLERLRLVDGQPMAIHRVWLPFALAPELARRSLDGGSLYETLEQEHGIRLTTARQRITAVAATGTDAKLLKVETGAPLIYTERLTRDTNNRPVELAENWSVPSLALWVELHR
jgi:DNA-binding GntR family transcriptional regulator